MNTSAAFNGLAQNDLIRELNGCDDPYKPENTHRDNCKCYIRCRCTPELLLSFDCVCDSFYGKWDVCRFCESIHCDCIHNPNLRNYVDDDYLAQKWNKSRSRNLRCADEKVYCSPEIYISPFTGKPVR